MAQAAPISVAEARSLVLAGVRPLPSEDVSLTDALGRVLARATVSDIDLPPFDASTMDGFAVRADDLAGASAAAPVALKVTAEIVAGDDGTGVEVAAGGAVRIMTGAPLPDGADAVVMIERTSAAEGGGEPGSEAQFLHAPAARENVRPRGQELRAGGLVLAAGEIVGAAAVGLLAATGNGTVAVHRRPRVAVLSTGDELAAPEQQVLGRGQVRDANGPMLAAQVELAGGVALMRGIVPDDLDATRAALKAAAAESDAVVVSGGVSVGDRDFVGPVLEELGQVFSRRVDMRPGKPQTLGTIAGVPFFGLPGNPVSAWVGFALFVRPVLRRLAGFTELDLTTVTARLAEDVVKREDRPYYLRGRLWREDGALTTAPSGLQTSAALASAHHGSCLIVLPQRRGTVPAGTAVECIRLDVEEGTP